MISYRTVAIPFAIVSFGLVGYDRIAAALHKMDIQKRLHAQIVADDPRLRGLQPAERVRTVLRAAERKARDSGDSLSYRLEQKPGWIGVSVSAPYRTKIAYVVGMPELPADFMLEFTIGN